MATKNQYLQQLYRDFEEETDHEGPIDLDALSTWALENGRWQPSPRSIRMQCRREFATAFRSEYITTPEGKRVRAKHATRTEQGLFWDDIKTIPRKRMETSLRQRRQQIVSDCYQLKSDTDFYNGANPDQPPIQMVFNFENDLVEIDFERRASAA